MTEHLTVIIPTRDRADVLKYTLAATLSLIDPKMTVLVSDNASVDETPTLLSTFQDPRLKVIRTPVRVSMRENWEYALRHVSNGWVTVIGDDDAILPGAHETVQRIAAETGAEAIRSQTAEFVWGTKGRTSTLSIPLARGYSIRHTPRELSRVMSGKQPYTTLPVLYNGGFIKIDALKRIALSDGSVFGSSIPDVYTGIALCSVLDYYVFCKEPLAINGASHHSGGTAAMASNSAAPKPETDPFRKFVNENDVPFHPLIPLLSDGSIVPSIHTFVLETFLTAQSLGIKLPVSVSMSEQYEIIRAGLKLRDSTDEYGEWLENFRKLNKINQEYSDFMAKSGKGLSRFRKLVELAKRLDLHTADSEQTLDLHTIVDAVNYCSRMKTSPPNRMLNGLHRLSARLGRFW